MALLELRWRGGAITILDVSVGLSGVSSLEDIPVRKSPNAETHLIEELYTCDPAGVVTVKIRNITSNYEREYRLGRESATALARPGSRKRSAPQPP
jgi:hypothetical protein